MSTKLAMRRSGTPSNCPLVLIHALPLDSSMWDEVRALLPEIDIITVDAPGFGDSPAGSEFSADPSIPAYAAAIKDVLDDAGITQIKIGGLSMGGAVAAEFVAQYPQMITGLALIDTGIGADDAPKREFRENMAQMAESGKAYEAVANWTTTMVSPNVSAVVRESLDQRFQKIPGDALAWIQRAMVNRFDRTDAIELVDGPVYFVRGVDDATCSLEYLMQLALRAEQPKIIEIEDAGHFSADEQPAALAQILAQFVAA
ncbi:alpha/beta fold hydrolase [Arcanobacterium hippocoleae]|uniref:Pimeloyl-ACP methyl ester carboxylesterase n=1 Tax=Arcanobacterium hippocoleae TaxID=149017 RepID=A0ABU1T3V1_9ACTO|nr:alpha/beta hydrolase [Arcanobacterium hippocoleae]MDR6939988.1 pimeloyl-ACP methyl ester carboxylesterase [Arcanobacterium hippocoleae]